MSTNRLKLYNSALQLCGVTALHPVNGLTENTKSRRELDAAWDNDAVRTCLEAGQWNFATRSIELVYTPDIEPVWGFPRAFVKPDDFLRLMALCSDDRFQSPVVKYFEESDYWFSDLDTLYVRYVSDDDAYGMDFGKWPHSFARYVEAYLADKVVLELSGGDQVRIGKIVKALKDAKDSALAKDALADAIGTPVSGSWVNSRGRSRTRDRTGGQLIG